MLLPFKNLRCILTLLLICLPLGRIGLTRSEYCINGTYTWRVVTLRYGSR